MSGKGSKPRPFSVPYSTYGADFDRIFRKKAGGTMQKPVGTTQKPPLRPIPATLPPKSPPESP